VTDCYATFIVENAPVSDSKSPERLFDFEWIEFRFAGFRGQPKSVHFAADSINPMVMYYDPTIWTDLTPEDSAFWRGK
jgi:hypothetical protein